MLLCWCNTQLWKYQLALHMSVWTAGANRTIKVATLPGGGKVSCKVGVWPDTSVASFLFVGQFKRLLLYLWLDHGHPKILPDSAASQPQQRLNTVQRLLLTGKNPWHREIGRELGGVYGPITVAGWSEAFVFVRVCVKVWETVCFSIK